MTLPWKLLWTHSLCLVRGLYILDRKEQKFSSPQKKQVDDDTNPSETSFEFENLVDQLNRHMQRKGGMKKRWEEGKLLWKHRRDLFSFWMEHLRLVWTVLWSVEKANWGIPFRLSELPVWRNRLSSPTRDVTKPIPVTGNPITTTPWYIGLPPAAAATVHNWIHEEGEEEEGGEGGEGGEEYMSQEKREQAANGLPPSTVEFCVQNWMQRSPREFMHIYSSLSLTIALGSYFVSKYPRFQFWISPREASRPVPFWTMPLLKPASRGWKCLKKPNAVACLTPVPNANLEDLIVNKHMSLLLSEDQITFLFMLNIAKIRHRKIFCRNAHHILFLKQLFPCLGKHHIPFSYRVRDLGLEEDSLSS
eukprot:CAMPEP_0113874794 /NCGR_PEP_ID=MMETSP0780_2-20120614/4544_1 /TAXON_ID=652834 /ORGANISM="Palpitomonas bilix" /LENGTH=361 /DNA_ID=CAMNT_0000860631 /DNA_START=1101 /DNA_END=2186 /DNA_ORIENTATION=+ /assembly_acc=CAM_ASM_000599